MTSLIYKLAPMDEEMRKLANVRKLRQSIMEVQEVRDVFTGQPVREKQYDVDHFIPWSFVMKYGIMCETIITEDKIMCEEKAIASFQLL